MKKSNYNQLVSLIFATARIIHEKIKHNKEAKFYSPLKMETLYFIKRSGNPLMKEVAEFLCVTPPSATSIIDQLVKSKIIIRQVGEKDRRKIRLAITSEGEKMIKKIREQKAKHLEKILAKLNSAEQENLIKILKKLSNI